MWQPLQIIGRSKNIMLGKGILGGWEGKLFPGSPLKVDKPNLRQAPLKYLRFIFSRVEGRRGVTR